MILVDPQDQWLLEQYTWTLKDGLYARTTIDGVYAFLHHCICGYPFAPLVVDHKDRNPLNNTRSNLRIVTQGVNIRNQARNDFHPMKYIVYNQDRNQYRVTIPFGSFNNLEDAQRVRDAILNQVGYGSDSWDSLGIDPNNGS